MKEKQNRQPIRTAHQLRRKHAVALGTRVPGVADLATTQSAWLEIQRSIGNRTTQRLIHETQSQATQMETLAQVLHQAVEEETTAAAKPALALDPARLGLERALPGHADKGAAPVAGVAPAAPAAIHPAAADTTVNVALRVLPLTEDRSKAAAEIAASHGRPGAAGWTTPSYEITVPNVQPDQIDIDVALGFNMELASEYQGAVLKVLRDHEQGHVSIGTSKATQHLVGDLKDDLKRLPDFTKPGMIQQGIQQAAARFAHEEGRESEVFDTIDYPRMQQAYQGAQTSLTDLEKAKGSIAATASALRSFLALKPPLNPARLETDSQALIDACDALSDDEKAMLQYNLELKALVEQTAAAIGSWRIWLDRKAQPDAAAADKLAVLAIVLESFDWKLPF